MYDAQHAAQVVEQQGDSLMTGNHQAAHYAIGQS